jgi:hypothetical protein
MNLTLTADPHTKRRFVLLAPAGVDPRGQFRQVEADPGWRSQLLIDMQRLRGRIYMGDGAITQDELTRDGRHVQAIDEGSWHLLVVGNSGRVLGCTRYLQHHPSTPYNALRVRTAALAQSGEWGESLRNAVEAELQTARKRNFSYIEVGGWALDESLRGSTDALRSVLFTYAWSHVLGGCLGLSMATHRNGSAAILRRIGGRPLEWKGVPIPAYYDPHYKCEMEVLRFDSLLPSIKYQHVINEMRVEMASVPVVSSLPTTGPWHSIVNRLCQVPGVVSANWGNGAVAPAA